MSEHGIGHLFHRLLQAGEGLNTVREIPHLWHELGNGHPTTGLPLPDAPPSTDIGPGGYIGPALTALSVLNNRAQAASSDSEGAEDHLGDGMMDIFTGFPIIGAARATVDEHLTHSNLPTTGA